MSQKLSHGDIQQVVKSLDESKTVNLDVSIRQLVESVAGVVSNKGDELSLHVLCCNEYFLVTGIVAPQLEEVRGQADSVREALAE
ncbi:hypothetical protein [Arthrobacter sp. HLT1-20]